MKFTQVLEQLQEEKEQTLAQWKKMCKEKGWTVEYDRDEDIWGAYETVKGRSIERSLFDTTKAQRHKRHQKHFVLS